MSVAYSHYHDLQSLLADGFIVLTPNMRLARRIRRDWAAARIDAGEGAATMPNVLPVQQWLMRQWQTALANGLVAPLSPLQPAQELTLWRQVIVAEEARGGSYHLLRPDAAAELASRARDTLLRWQIPLSSSSIRQLFTLDADCAAWLRWLSPFEQRLATSGQCAPADCIEVLLQCAARLPTTPVALLAFDDIPPLERAVVTALAQPLVEVETPGDPVTPTIHACADPRSQLRDIAHWARTVSVREPQASVGIVLTDMSADRHALEHLLRREFNCLDEDYGSLPVNFSTGIPLHQAPVIRDALAVLALGLRRTSVMAVEQLMCSRFLHLPDAVSPLSNRLLVELHEAGRMDIDVAELRFRAGSVRVGQQRGHTMGRYLQSMAALRHLRTVAPPSVWIERFSEVLQLWGWPSGSSLDSLEYQQVELWYRTLDEYRAYDSVCANVPYAEALQLLRDTCVRQVSQPQTAEARVQVLGPLEAAGLSFDYLWLCGMQAGTWPAAARPNPFIPVALQRQAKMPHASAEREWEFSRALLQQYQRCAGELHASYTVQADGIPVMPSALLGDCSSAPVGESATALPRGWQQLWQERDLQHIADACAPVVDDDELATISGGSGLLEDQSQCPFRAFARRRLQVDALSAYGVGLSPAQRGSLLHDALYRLWGSLNDHAGLVALDEETVHKRVTEAVDDAVAAVPTARRLALGASFWSLEGQRLSMLLAQWLQIERQRAAFVVLQREQKVSLQLGRLVLRLQVDRIDQLPDGSLLVVDYKSGVSRVTDWLGDRPAKPQMLLYGIAAPGAASAIAFAQLRPGDCKFVGLGEASPAPGIRTDIEKVAGESMMASDWQALNARWRQTLQRLAQEFVDGDAVVAPLTTASCRWCGLQPLCRVECDSGNTLAEDECE